MLLAIVLSAFLVVSVVAWHYWALGALYRLMPDRDVEHSHFLRSVGILLTLVLVHLVEICWFAAGLYAARSHLGIGTFTDPFEPVLRDYLYYSLVTYSTLGLSEFSPVGHMKILTGIESLVGFILLTWTASFFYALLGRTEVDKG